MNHLALRRFVMGVCFLLSIVMSLNGCIYLVVGSLGALGGYVVSPDTVEGITSREEGEVWDTALQVVSIMGNVLEKNQSDGIILAKIIGAKVTVNIIPVHQSSIKLRVKARKSFLPKISVAQDVYVKIMNELIGD